MILAAGRGERMRPLSDRIPKPLLEVGGTPLIVRHLQKLAAAGCTEVVINHAHLGDMIEAALGDGGRYGVNIAYSREPHALETAGGIAFALPLLGAEPFVVVNADVYSEFDYARLLAAGARLGEDDAWLVLVDNPAHHPDGDFALRGRRVVTDGARLTFSGLAVYRPQLFAGLAPGSRAPLAPLLRAAIAAGRAGGDYFEGAWSDVGTPERLTALDRALRQRRV